MHKSFYADEESSPMASAAEGSPSLTMSIDDGYLALCARAMFSRPSGRITLKDLYAWIDKHCPDIRVCMCVCVRMCQTGLSGAEDGIVGG